MFTRDLTTAADSANARVGAAQADLLGLIAEIDRAGAWEGDGARDVAHWVAMRYAISAWKAHRWVAAAHALPRLPSVAEALASGALSIDTATVSSGAVRRRGDLVSRLDLQEDRDADRDRSLSWWYSEEGRRWNLQAELPAASGAVVVRAIERMATEMPELPDEDAAADASARRADALVALCSARIASDPDPDRATVVVHARLDGLEDGSGGTELEGGPVIHPETVRRLLCNARVQTVVENESGDVIGMGRLTREPSAWMVRQIRHRDRECRFPGWGARAFTEAAQPRTRRAGPVVPPRWTPISRRTFPWGGGRPAASARDRLTFSARARSGRRRRGRGARAGPDRGPEGAVNSRVGRGSRSSPAA